MCVCTTAIVQLGKCYLAELIYIYISELILIEFQFSWPNRCKVLDLLAAVARFLAVI